MHVLSSIAMWKFPMTKHFDFSVQEGFGYETNNFLYYFWTNLKIAS